MTREELAAIGLASYGPHWQSPLARAIGTSPRHMRRLVSGESPITDGIAADIRKVLGAADIADPDWPRDAWIVGDGAEQGREYVVHVKRPRFVARAIAVGDDGLPEPGEQPADILTGIVYSGDGYMIAEIVWIDPPPAGPGAMYRLLEQAADAIDASAE